MKNSAKLPNVEAGRGIAACLVVLFHCMIFMHYSENYGIWVFDGFFKIGRAGVDFFFVLSGFIMAYVHHSDVGRPEKLRSYAWKRVWRIFPLYWTITFLVIVLNIIRPGDDPPSNLVSVLRSLFLVAPDGMPIVGVGWTLQFELLFYIIFGALLFDRRLGRFVLAAWFLGILLNATYETFAGSALFGGFAGRLIFRIFNLEFFLGMAVASLARRFSWRPAAMFAVGSGLFLAVGIVDVWGPPMPIDWPPKHLGYGLSSAIALYGLVMIDLGGRTLTPRWLTTVGSASYSIYLIHYQAALGFALALRFVRHSFEMPAAVAFFVVAAGSIFVGIIFHWIVERRLIRLGVALRSRFIRSDIRTGAPLPSQP